ncbi:MAG: enoyl-CoA hydratase/isomerase family protein [Terasakiella sp.]|uniref:enoyl-CoA hydratase/isomerase family protein n=1 Tax=unclassified Terasakiella TaxID=2614952 RepID=UPI003B0099A5
MSETSKIEIDARGVATLTMTRGDMHNAFDDAMIADLTLKLKELDANDAVRVVVLAAEGKSFSAGADLNWMKRMAGYSYEENFSDAMGLGGLLQTLNFLSKPTIARVQGAAFGGGVGLVAACDMAVGTERASFCLSEVKLGLIPAVISPYVVNAMGQRASRRYMLTAERFKADEALRFGLLHRVVNEDELDGAVEDLIASLMIAGPNSVAACKDLVFAVYNRPVDEAVIKETAERIAKQRASDEGKEGLSAFLEKRKPAWVEG